MYCNQNRVSASNRFTLALSDISFDFPTSILPMKLSRVNLLVIFSITLFGIDNMAAAQMFGNRNVGQPLDRRNPLTAAGESETLTGSERFLRENREPRQFIGGTPGDMGFVGMVEASDPANTAVQLPQLRLPGIRPDRAAIINRPLNLRRPNSMMAPPLSIEFGTTSQTDLGFATQVQKSLDQLLQTRFPSQFQVSVAGSVVTLRGVARDQAQRQLVEIMTTMEPGIDEVRNQIVVNPAPLPSPKPAR